jgi:transcriptional regulator of heat shock response
VVEEYIQRGEPVSSHLVAHLSRLSLSPATVRNEMAELGEEGYLEQPHVSSGRVPSDLGYRYYVDHLMPQKAVPGFFRGERNLREVMRWMSRTLGVAVLVSPERGRLQVVGLSALLGRKDPPEGETLAGLLDLLEEEGFMTDLLWRSGDRGVTALIGHELPDERMHSFSLIAGGERGRVGILGPRRVDYALGFALVREVGGCL